MAIHLIGSEPVFTLASSNGILMIHGFTSTPFEFREMTEHFAQHGISVSVPLIRGHGTTPEDLNKVKWYDWFEDVKYALFELRKHCKKVIVIGQSMGGTLALHLASHYQVEGVVTLAAGVFVKQKKKSRLLPFVTPFVKVARNNRGPDIFDETAKKTAISYKETPLSAAQELKKMFMHVKRDLSEVYAPALLIHSTNDHVIDYKSSRYIYDHISSRDKRLLSLNKSYHVLTLDTDKAIVLSETDKFVRRIFRIKQTGTFYKPSS